MKQTLIRSDYFYTITAACGKVMEAVETTDNGAAVQLGNYEKKASQQWSFVREGDGVYRIKNRATGKLIDLVMTGTVNGTWLHMWEDVSGSSQLWIMERTNDGCVKFKAQCANTKCIDLVDMNTEAGARLQIWEDVNGENQLWTIEKVPAEKKTRTTKKAVAEGETVAKKPRTRKTAAKKAAE